VPCVSAEEIRRLSQAVGPAPGVAFTPSRSGLGTNGALLAPCDAMPLTFGVFDASPELATLAKRMVGYDRR